MQTRVARTSVRSALAATRPQVTLRPLTVAQYDCMFGTTVGSGQAAVVDSRQLHVVRRTLARQHTTAFARNMSTAEGEKKAEADANAKSESKEETKSDSSAGASGQDSQAAKKPSRWYRLIEDAKDVLAVTFGYERKRDIGLEVDMGLREYPWVCYTDPATEKLMYRNNDTGVVTDIKPSDFDKRAKPSARLEVNHAASDIAVVKTQQTPWERTLNVMYNTPIIQGLLAVGETVAASPVGKAAEKVKAKVADVKEDLQEKWETSQHPVVVNAAYLVDSVLAETEQGRALREIKQLDAGFDEYTFISHMRDEYIPMISRAFFKLDMPVLRAHCKETALAQMRAVQAARDLEGLTHDGMILQVSRVELLQARSLERGVPIVLVTAQVQYIHCVRNKMGEVVEGSESEIRAAVLVLAVAREFEASTGELAWKTVEMSMQGSQLYL